MKRLGLAALALLLVAACTLSGESHPGPTTDQLLHSARQAYAAALDYHVSVSFVVGGKHYRQEVNVHRPDASGSETLEDLGFEFMLSGGALYRRGHDFVQQTSGDQVAKLVGDGWLKAEDAQIAADLQRFLDPGLFDDLQGHHPSVARAGQVALHGHTTQRLIDGTRSLFVDTKAPGYLIRLEDPEGKYLTDGATNLVMDFFDFGVPVTVTPPSGFVDLSDPATLPARFIATSIDASNCDRSGCTLKAAVRNDGGPGSSTADFTLESGGSVIDRCTAPIAASAYNGTQEVSCRVSSQAWTNWIDGHPGGSYQFRVKPSNPAYQ